jgi:hypothetical protein
MNDASAGEAPGAGPFGDVDPGYRHVAKTATPGPLLTLGRAELKWYDLAAGAGVAADVRGAAQAHLRQVAREGSLGLGAAADAGFVILHRCGTDFYFLLTSVWRGSNELWQSVLYRDGGTANFAPFDPAYPPPGAVRPTFCVWELGIVGFEARAWTAFLRTPRGEADRERWRAARLAGECA